MKEFWDFDENLNYIPIKANDGLYYKVWNEGSQETLKEVADVLAKVRHDINTILIYAYKNRNTWYNHPIAFGMFHTFDIHTPEIYNLTNPRPEDFVTFVYQEMAKNNWGGLGLNKPKVITSIQVEYKGKEVEYPIAERRAIFLTIRNLRNNKLNKYSTVLDLAIHELTHTTCNDVKWKKDNHLHPYPVYHKLMRTLAKKAGVLN
jgi:hypothetical protein